MRDGVGWWRSWSCRAKGDDLPYRKTRRTSGELDCPSKSHSAQAAQVSKKFVAGDGFTVIGFGEAGFEFGELFGGETDPFLALAGEDKDLGAVNQG